MHASSCRCCCFLPTGQTVLMLTLRTVAIHPASFVVVVGVVFCLLNKTVLWLRFQSCYCLQSYHACCCCCCLLPIGQNRFVVEVSVLLLSAIVSCLLLLLLSSTYWTKPFCGWSFSPFIVCNRVMLCCCCCCLLPIGQNRFVVEVSVLLLSAIVSCFVVVVVVFYLLDKTVLWLKFQSFYCLQSCHALLLSLLLLFCIITLSSICRLLKKHPGHRRVKLTTVTPLWRKGQWQRLDWL